MKKEKDEPGQRCGQCRRFTNDDQNGFGWCNLSSIREQMHADSGRCCAKFRRRKTLRS